MSEKKIKVSWNDIEQKSNSSNTTDLSEITVPLEVNKKPSWGLGKIAGIITVIVICAVIAFFSFSSIEPDYKRPIETVSSIEPDYKRPIETVLAANKNIASGLDGESAVKTFKIIVSRMRSINLSECPEDFQQAYQRHTEAWAKTVPIFQEIEDMSSFGRFLKDFLFGFIAGYTGQFHLLVMNILSDVNASDELKAAVNRIDEEIETTFYEVLRIAHKYKVNTTPYSN